jgi:hypothetical protein
MALLAASSFACILPSVACCQDRGQRPSLIADLVARSAALTVPTCVPPWASRSASGLVFLSAALQGMREVEREGCRLAHSCPPGRSSTAA